MRDVHEMAGQEDEKKLYGAHVRGYVESDGGKVIYKPVDAGSGRIEWEVFLLRYDGIEKQVHISSTDMPKRIRTAEALFNYHKSLYPDGPTLEVPYFKPANAASVDVEDDD
ncbi:hypothetical protein [uncultured Jannaschia sp.]|uniref:hypothetical protein n=1 Tax=uncultured Jannaschia sp. TaxID=293347 RepID=UPI00261AFA93|nr:hypothetical protein [uncultured Jannaschia sp.]